MSTDTIAARRQHIQDNAPCVGCGATLADCKANRGKDPTAPEWFGCCARGLTMDPCQHQVDTRALMALVAEIESGTVRTVEEVTAEARPARTGMSWFEYLNQGEKWHPNGKPLVAIADMDAEWRYNAAQFLERRAPIVAAKYKSARDLWFIGITSIERDIEREDAEIDRDPVAWIRTTPLHRALVAGLPTKPKKLAALAERARHWSTCPARGGTGDCRCQQIRVEREHLTECALRNGTPDVGCTCRDTSPDWTI